MLHRVSIVIVLVGVLAGLLAVSLAGCSTKPRPPKGDVQAKDDAGESVPAAEGER